MRVNLKRALQAIAGITVLAILYGWIRCCAETWKVSISQLQR